MVGGASVNPHNLSLKFLCSYGGRILPRYPDGKLRYNGGDTRVLSLDRSISFSELMAKLGEMCGTPVSLRCQLPTEDLDALVSITCDEDLINIIEEYDRTAVVSSPSPIKIRAFLFNPKTAVKKVSPPASSSSSNDATSPKSLPPRGPTRCVVRHVSRPPAYPVLNNGRKVARQQYAYGNNGQCYFQ